MFQQCCLITFFSILKAADKNYYMRSQIIDAIALTTNVCVFPRFGFEISRAVHAVACRLCFVHCHISSHKFGCITIKQLKTHFQNHGFGRQSFSSHSFSMMPLERQLSR